MKARNSSVLILLAALSAVLVSSSSASPAPAAEAFPVGSVERYGATIIRPGDSATKVVAYLGNADQKLSSDTWLYRRFQSKRDPAHGDDCTTLLVSFSQGRVSDLQRVNEAAVQIVAAKLTAPKPAAQMLAGK